MTHGSRIILAILLFTAAAHATDLQFDFQAIIGRCRVLWVAAGDAEISGLGGVVALYDADRDGVRDLLATGFRPGSNATYFRLLSGRTGATLRTFSVSGGPYIAGVSDFSGDGKQDVLLTAYIRETGGDPPSAGPGRYRTSVLDVHNGRTIWTRFASKSHPDFGISVGVINDRSGDGVPDVLLVDAVEETPGSKIPVFYVISGKDGKTAGRMDAPQGASTFLGSGIAAARLDADSVPDLLYSDILFGPTMFTIEARLWAVSGATGETLWSLRRPSDSLFGDTVLAGPDVDGDGAADVVVASPNDREYVRGSVQMFSGRTGRRIWAAGGKVLSGQFSRGLTILRDLNGDGISEIAAGGPASMPPMLVSEQPGHFQVLSGKDGKTLIYAREVLPEGRDFSTHFGMNLAAPGDLDRDGNPDLVVAAPSFGVPGEEVSGLIVAFALE